MTNRASRCDRIAATQLALEYVVGNLPAMRRIARTCHAELAAVTGPAVDAVARLLLRNLDPAENFALLRDYVARELRPACQTVDPMTLSAHGGVIEPLDLYSNWLYHAGTDGRVRHVRGHGGPSGRNHRCAGWRARARHGRALEAGQSAFTGLGWREPAEDGVPV